MLLREREKALSSSGQKLQASVAGLSRLGEQKEGDGSCHLGPRLQQIPSPQGGVGWEEGGRSGQMHVCRVI